MKTIVISAILLFSSLLALKAQDTVSISLESAIRRAANQSVDAVVAKNEYVSSYWEYRTYKAELLPEVTFNGTLPYYSKSYNPYQNADGLYTYVSNDYSQIDAGLSITQNIPLTGGKIAVESSLQRLEQYGDNSLTRYKSIPGAIRLEQPVFGFNSIGWKQKIEPVKKKESEQKLIADIENVSNAVIAHYFNLLIAQANYDISQQNLENTKKLYFIAEARYKIGQISENELLQLKISMLNSESAMVEAQANLDSRMFQLKSFLEYDGDIVLKPAIPELFSSNISSLNYEEVLSLANQNNAFTQKTQREMLEASRSVSQAKADRWNFTVFASFGMSGQNERFSNSFNNLRNNQIVEVGVKMPILDWGKKKGQLKIAEANKEVTNSKIRKEQRDFNQNIFLTVQNFNNQPKQLLVAEETDKIAQQRYKTSVEAFILGKIEVLNLNDAQSSKDIARRNYIEQAFLLWSYYYQIRSLTLYDFIGQKELTVNYSDYLN